jgi:hypothetical protein
MIESPDSSLRLGLEEIQQPLEYLSYQLTVPIGRMTVADIKGQGRGDFDSI